MDSYLNILEESLQKKLVLLDRIQEYNDVQQQVFSSESVEIDKFDEAIEEKGHLIEQIGSLDEGFETLYANVAEELKINRAKYAEQIKRLQQLVQQVTDKSVSVQAQEARNKELIEAFFAKEKRQIGQGRRSSKVAYSYYSSASRVAQAEPQFMDSRQ